jgi:transposase-like protein
MQNNEIEVQQLLELNPQDLNTLNECSDALGQLSALADTEARNAVTAGKAAIRYAAKGGAVCNRAKEIAQHGEFLPWLAQQSEKFGREQATLYRWMKLAKLSLLINLESQPDVKSITDAYRATGILPEPEPKPEGEGDKDKPPFSLSFRTVYRLPSEWNRDAAKDFLYEFDRLARLAVQLKTEFGL